jgi:succinate dehydrogenase / fumarate reductase, cytochrome b subunit
MATGERPISPHLQIYRWQISNTLSIMHRLSGVLLSIGFIALSLWLIGIASGAAGYGYSMGVLRSPFGVIAVMGFTLAYFYHLLNGIRHLFWDVGVGFEKPMRSASGWAVLAGAAALTAAVMVWVLR